MTSFQDRFREFGPGVEAPKPNRVELCDEAGTPIARAVSECDLATWLDDNGAWVRTALVAHGALLLRGFVPGDEEAFGPAVDAFDVSRMSYSDQHTPRREVGRDTYTSTEYPSTQSIELHSEMSYAARWPRTLWFFCVTPAVKGGATPLADNRVVYRSIPEKVRERFERSGVRYVRNFGTGVGLDWRIAFRVDDRASLATVAERDGLDLEWRGDDHLRVSFDRRSTLRDELSGKPVWFNQAHAFHPSSLPPGVRAALSRTHLEDDFPNNVVFGDGTPIPEADLIAVRDAYAAASTRFDWREGDLLVVDNMLAAHGRDPFVGSRRILVAMSGERLATRT